MPSTPSSLYPDAAPHAIHAVDAGDGHRLHVEESGLADGIPAVVLHGGPGSGCSPLLRRFFDPSRYRVICIDQRGAGRSTPAGCTDHSTTTHLLADLQRARQRLGITRWLVVGGSWGATLALAHALHEPTAVAGLLLRASFLARPGDIAGFFDGAPPVLASGWQLLPDMPVVEARAVVRAWARHERQRSAPLIGASADSADDAAIDALLPRYRIQSHYLRHGCWLQQPPLLERLAALPALSEVPTLLLHGTEDRVCPPEGARALQASLPNAALRWAVGAGHDPTHPAMVALMVDALDSWAISGRFQTPAPTTP